jgi:hypothetical protein
MPILRAVETFIIVIDFIKLQGYNSADAMSFVTKHCDGQPHLKIWTAAADAHEPAKPGSRGICGPTTETVDEGTGRGH